MIEPIGVLRFRAIVKLLFVILVPQHPTMRELAVADATLSVNAFPKIEGLTRIVSFLWYSNAGSAPSVR